jgi:hypothetical protein
LQVNELGDKVQGLDAGIGKFREDIIGRVKEMTKDVQGSME